MPNTGPPELVPSSWSAWPRTIDVAGFGFGPIGADAFPLIDPNGGPDEPDPEFFGDYPEVGPDDLNDGWEVDEEDDSSSTEAIDHLNVATDGAVATFDESDLENPIFPSIRSATRGETCRLRGGIRIRPRSTGSFRASMKKACSGSTPTVDPTTTTTTLSSTRT
jgi:hypothetical protein